MSEKQERFARFLELYELRNGLFRLVANLPEDRLRRLARATSSLTPDELDAALGYIEGLAAWSEPVQQSDDAAFAQGPAQTGTTGTGS